MSGASAVRAPKDPAAAEAFAEVLATMQNVEELGGPEGMAYVSLMLAISHEALTRATACMDTLELQPGASA